MTEFDRWLAEVTAGGQDFGHRQHVQLTWLAVRSVGAAQAIDLISDGIRRTASDAGAPQKYHATMSRAWVELVAHHEAQEDVADFDDFASRNPALLDKRLLARFYSSAALASPQARTGWVEPDLAPFPWMSPAGLPPPGRRIITQ